LEDFVCFPKPVGFFGVSPLFQQIQENFFDLGGHSALAAKMATELSGEYSLPVTVSWCQVEGGRKNLGFNSDVFP